ncbi:YbeD family protein [Thalassoroseus pseudoceratinae]|uniref:YbeD family protein n=1 Tax=Thalassoroseus pseudoceratinae TaxID=2713176 RepID=UPI001F1156FF|nr:DUF493 domain-containing protein [Thalassoroseus pseudoceratinae]
MFDQSMIELLQERHDFPCAFTFKAIGRSDAAFTARVLSAVRQHLDAEEDPPHSLRETSGGRHVAITVEPVVESATQVLSIHQAIAEIDGLVVQL